MMTKSVSHVCQGLSKRIFEEAVEASPLEAVEERKRPASMVAIVATPLRAQTWTPLKEGATLQPHILQVFTM